MIQPAPVLSVRNIVKRWREGDRGIEIEIAALDLRAGEIKALTGPSGSGKSTALDMLGLALRPDDIGAMTLSHADGDTDLRPIVTGSSGDARAAVRARYFSYVVQTSELIPFLSLADDIDLQQRISGTPDPSYARQLAEQLDIVDLMSSVPAALSVGQRQRAAVVRAAAARPAILLADEPTSALDPDLKDRVLALLKTCAEAGSAVLIVTHDHALLETFAIPQVAVVAERLPGGWSTRFDDRDAA